jgi:hypothetical protein
MPEPPTLKISTGRRLRDGKIQHMASFPGVFNSINIEDFFSIDLLFMVVCAVFLLGIYVGRKFNKRKMKTKRHIEKQTPQQIVYYQLPPGFDTKNINMANIVPASPAIVPTCE